MAGCVPGAVPGVGAAPGRCCSALFCCSVYLVSFQILHLQCLYHLHAFDSLLSYLLITRLITGCHVQQSGSESTGQLLCNVLPIPLLALYFFLV